MSVIDLLGWAGALGILVAYGLLTVGRWASASLSYQGANAVAAAALLVWAVSIQAWQSALLNGVWALVGVVGVARALRRQPGVPPAHVGD